MSKFRSFPGSPKPTTSITSSSHSQSCKKEISHFQKYTTVQMMTKKTLLCDHVSGCNKFYKFTHRYFLSGCYYL